MIVEANQTGEGVRGEGVRGWSESPTQRCRNWSIAANAAMAGECQSKEMKKEKKKKKKKKKKEALNERIETSVD